MFGGHLNVEEIKFKIKFILRIKPHTLVYRNRTFATTKNNDTRWNNNNKKSSLKSVTHII